MQTQTDNHWPLIWLHDGPGDGRRLKGIQALMPQGPDVRRLEWNGRFAGSCWSDAEADYCCLAGILPGDITAPRPHQTRQVFDNLSRILDQAGMNFSNVVRTWLFLDNLLDWYDEFNGARDAFFRKAGVFQHLVPASTGIGAANPAGAALMAGAVAVRPKHPGLKIAAIDSPMQCPATDYHSSFSRAVEITFPGRRHLIISGTASIAPDGSTLHPGDTSAQIDQTMRVVQAILESRGMGWNSAVRAIAYFNRIADAPLLSEYYLAHGIRNLPLINLQATVCRPGLLFEIEADAVRNEITES